VAIQSAAAPDDGTASLRGPARLSWFDLILVASLSLGAFGIGAYVAAQVSFLAGPAVSQPSIFQAAAGVPAATNNVASLAAISEALHARIGTEYVSAIEAGSVERDKLLTKLESAADALAREQGQARVSLTSANDRANAARSQELTRRHWKETALRAATSLACYAVLAAIACTAAWWAAIRITLLPVLSGGLLLLIAFLIADVATWAAGLVFIILAITLLIRERRGETGRA